MKSFLSVVLLFISFVSSFAQSGSDCMVYSHDVATPPPFKIKGKTIGSQSGHYNMSWLDKEIKSKQGIMIGESHWMNTVQAMAKDIIFRANEIDAYPILILEQSYSIAPFVNAYINCQTDDCDKLFEVIKPKFSSKESLALLNDLKAWNAAHPQKKITVVCSDFEQDYIFSLRHIFLPYFEAVGVHDLKDRVNAAKDVTPEIYAYMDSVLRNSPASTTVKDKPFITKALALEVFHSFTGFYEAIQASRAKGTDDAFMEVRAQYIYQNLTAPEKIGGLITKQKFVLWGGSSHVRVYQLENDNFLKFEGWKLANEFAPLKGKVVSVRLENLSFGIPELYQTSDIYKKGTPQFAYLVDAYKSCNKAPGAFEMWVPTTVVQATLHNFKKNQDQPIWFKGNEQMAKLVKKKPELQQDAKLKEYYSHDYVVLLPYATLFERLN